MILRAFRELYRGSQGLAEIYRGLSIFLKFPILKKLMEPRRKRRWGS